MRCERDPRARRTWGRAAPAAPRRPGEGTASLRRSGSRRFRAACGPEATSPGKAPRACRCPHAPGRLLAGNALYHTLEGRWVARRLPGLRCPQEGAPGSARDAGRAVALRPAPAPQEPNLAEVAGGAQRPEPARLPLCGPGTAQLCWTRDRGGATGKPTPGRLNSPRPRIGTGQGWRGLAHLAWGGGRTSAAGLWGAGVQALRGCSDPPGLGRCSERWPGAARALRPARRSPSRTPRPAGGRAGAVSPRSLPAPA